MKISNISGNGKPEKISYVFSKESFSYILGKANPEKIIYILGWTSKAPKTKICDTFPKKVFLQNSSG